jgi:hypothetical protein
MHEIEKNRAIQDEAKRLAAAEARSQVEIDATQQAEREARHADYLARRGVAHNEAADPVFEHELKAASDAQALARVAFDVAFNDPSTTVDGLGFAFGRLLEATEVCQGAVEVANNSRPGRKIAIGGGLGALTFTDVLTQFFAHHAKAAGDAAKFRISAAAGAAGSAAADRVPE